MEQKVKRYVQNHHMIEKTDRIVAGVSGGADSICLLFVLLKLQKELGFQLLAVHVNHRIRGVAADADQMYVEEICKEQGVPLVVYKEDVPEYARRHKMTEEEAGREVRRTVFQQQMEEWGGTKIALAHHKNDNVETLIFHLCRGTGLSGLAGIAPQDGPWIRPLLCVEREEIESYLKKRGISYCTDETNLDIHYTRNRIRHEVLPYLEQYINRESVSHMARTMEEMTGIKSYVEKEVKHYAEQCVTGTCEKILVNSAEYRKVPKELKNYVLHHILCAVAGRKKDIQAVHIEALEKLFEQQTGRRLNLPYEITARRCYEGVMLIKSRKSEDEETSNPKESENETPENLYHMRVFEYHPEEETFPEKVYTKWFDYDIINNTVKIRHRQSGDYITVNEVGGTQKLKQYFINEKIPQEKRDRIWLVADGHHILWIVGYRQNQAYQITDRTKHVLEITFYGGKKNGRNSESDDSGRRGSKEN